MSKLTEQLERMSTLQPNWDGYGASQPQNDAIALAKELVAWFTELERTDGVDRHIRVNPTRVGGVLIEWEDQRFEHELEVYPDGSLELLNENKITGEMEEQRFNPETCVINPIALASLRRAVAA